MKRRILKDLKENAIGYAIMAMGAVMGCGISFRMCEVYGITRVVAKTLLTISGGLMGSIFLLILVYFAIVAAEELSDIKKRR